MKLFVLSGMLLCATQLSLAQEASLGEVVVTGTNERPTATVTILADDERYACQRDPTSGMVCRAHLPLSSTTFRIEIVETGFLPFTKNFVNVPFKQNVATVSVGKVTLVPLPKFDSLPTLPHPVPFHLPKVTSDAPLRVVDIRTSADNTETVHWFDVVLANAGKQTVLKQFWKSWAYSNAGPVATQPAYSLKPNDQYSVEFLIDITHPSDTAPQLLPSPLAIPAGTPADPNLVALRLAVYYTLANGDSHPSSGWDLEYSLYLEDIAGARVPVFVDEHWK